MKEKVVILGAGESGVGAALLATSKGYDVFLSDLGKISEKYKTELEQNNIKFEEGGHSLEIILSADLVIKSPGIPDDIALITAIRERSIPIIGEIEFAFRFTEAKMYVITGTNGKTTTTLLLYHLLKTSGFSVGLAGNVGHSLARQVIKDQYESYIVELSSFQIDSLINFKAHVAILLNITPDHLNRYGYDFKNYVNSKFGVLKNMTEKDHFIFNYDDDVIREEVKRKELKMNRWPIGFNHDEAISALSNDAVLNFKMHQLNRDDFSISTSVIPLHGRHNMINTMAAVLAARIAGLSVQAIEQNVRSFINAEHRLEPVGDVNGVKFVNDSKATNVDAVFYALGAFDTPLIWIAGGIDKGNEYEQLLPLVEKNVKALVCLGIDNEPLIRSFKSVVPVCIETDNIKDAVEKSFSLAAEGDVVLLSPACASFDLFENYQDRGNQFKAEVKKLIENIKTTA